MILDKLSFRPLGLNDTLIPAILKAGYKQPYPIQQKAIPEIVAGKDVLGIAETGSGKTAAYLLPIIDKLLHKGWELENRHIATLILVPTRELAMQVEEVMQTFNQHLDKTVKTLAVYGGASINPQMIKMQGVQVLIATTGRLLDLIDSKALSLSSLKVLVLDEADKMLNSGFEKEMSQLLALMPIKRQNLLFSATLSPELDSLTRLLLKDPVTVEVISKEQEIDLISQRSFRVSAERKGPFLRYLIRTMSLGQILVFVSSTKSADKLVEKLNKNGVDARASHSKKSQGARNAALFDFKSGTLEILVATDLLGRGIDIEELPCVINYELPRSPKDFVHRIGRTGRAENKGLAITLVTPEEQHHFKIIQKKMGKYLTLEGTEDVDLHGM